MAPRTRVEPPEGRLRVVSNTFVSLRSRPVFVVNHSTECRRSWSATCLAAPPGEQVRGPAETEGNLDVPLSAFVDPGALDFALRGDRGCRAAPRR